MTTATITRPLLADVLDPAALEAEIADGRVTRKAHPTLPLSILTYSRTCQYDNHWTAVTMRCRGLVMDEATGRIVAWCLPKFFNHSQHNGQYPFAPPLPVEPFEVYDKVDGSLAIVFHYEGRWHAASKGSFISEQAVWAQQRLDRADTGALDPAVTYLAEALYPENRIVVNYGDRRDLVLLAAFQPDGSELLLADAAAAWSGIGSVVRAYGIRDGLELLARMAEENTHLDGTSATGSDAEGWVVRFASGARAKIKHSEYTRLHRILTGINARDVWRALAVTVIGNRVDAKRTAQALTCSAAEIEAMRTVADPIGAILDNVPDEFDQWVRGICAELTAHADALLTEIEASFEELLPLAGDRGAFARAAQRLDPAVRAAMFLMLDGKELALHIWRTIKPEVSTPFRDDEEG